MIEIYKNFLKLVDIHVPDILGTLAYFVKYTVQLYTLQVYWRCIWSYNRRSVGRSSRWSAYR